MINSADPDQLASQEPTDLDLHCLQREGISRFSMTRVNGEIKDISSPFSGKKIAMTRATVKVLKS